MHRGETLSWGDKLVLLFGFIVTLACILEWVYRVLMGSI